MGRGRRMPGGMPGGMPGNKNNMMKQIQKMQDEMLKAQAELEEKEVEATAGGRRCQSDCFREEDDYICKNRS